jgi:DNA-binding NtrC family response regulator
MNAHVLVVDDERLMRFYLRETLQAAGYRVWEAGSASEALEIARNPEFGGAFAVVDYRLPDVDGLRLLVRLRQLRPECPVALMTADGSTSLGEAALGAGAYGILQKPFDVAALVGLVRSGCRDDLR